MSTKQIHKTILFKDGIISFNLSEGNLQIENSYLIKSSDDMRKILTQISLANDTEYVCPRTTKSMIREWKSHNLLYYLGLFKERTKHVDLNFKSKWYENVGYFIISLLYWD